MMMLRVKCPCGHELGKFDNWDDHGSIDMLCPVCEETNTIHQQVLCFPEDHTRFDDKGKFIEAEIAPDRQ